jgi:hypothetical protein
MTLLGRRKHVRFLLAQPVEGNLRLREEVSIEELTDREAVILSPEPCRMDERLTLEIPGDLYRRVNVRVSECRPAVSGDGAIRHRCRLSIESYGSDAARGEGGQA